MYKLYDGHGTSGSAVRAALAEIGAQFETIDVDLSAGVHKTDWFSSVNPCQQVPVLALPDGSVLTETIAILMHLADAHPEAGIAPKCGTVERSQVNRWLSFFAMNIYGPEYLRMRPTYYTTDPAGAPGIAEAATEFLSRHYAVFEQVMSNGPYLLEDQFTILDIYVWMLVQWWGDTEGMRRNWPKTHALVAAVSARPKVNAVQVAQFGPIVRGN